MWHVLNDRFLCYVKQFAVIQDYHKDTCMFRCRMSFILVFCMLSDRVRHFGGVSLGYCRKCVFILHIFRVGLRIGDCFILVNDNRLCFF